MASRITTGLLVAVAVAAALLASHGVAANSCAGCVDLDELNFDRTLARFPFALVKFDIAFPYGDKHEAFAQFSRAAHKVTDELLVATVGIKDYGEMENKALGERFGLHDKNLPGVFLFKGGAADAADAVPLPAHLDVTLPNLQKFVTDNTPLYIGLDGCLKQLNPLAKGFANLADAAQLEAIERAEAAAAALAKEAEQANAKIYLAFMRKVREKGYGFVEEETKRLLRLKGGQVSDAKKAELQRRLNVLDTFRVARLTKEEL